METNNNYFIVNMAERVMNGDSTLFLNQAELKRLTRILNKNKCKYEVYIPYPDAEKVIVYSDIKPDVSLLEIISKKDITQLTNIIEDYDLPEVDLLSLEH